MINDTILAVDDDERITRILKLQLSHHGYDVICASDGDEALELFTSRPDIRLVLLDIMLPGTDGISLCRKFRQINPEPKILLVSAKGKSKDVIDGLDSGADDYIKKPFIFDELLARVRANLRKSLPADKSVQILRYKDLRVDPGAFEVHRGEERIELSATEYDLLYYLTLNNNLVQSREHIIERVWGGEHAGSPNIVDVYIKFLRDKIDREGFEKLIHTVRGRGYVLR